MPNHAEKNGLRSLTDPAERGDLVIHPPSGRQYDIWPAGAFVLAGILQAAETTAGGIIVPEKVRDGRMPQWEVLAVGPGSVGPKGERIPVNVKQGEHILVSHELGAVLELPDHERRTALIHESAVIAVIAERPAIAS